MTATTKRLADLCVGIQYNDFPDEAIRKGKECILDTMGCMLAGYKGEEAAILLKYVKEAGGKPEATIVGSGQRSNAVTAALVNGTLGHALDFDDNQHSLMGHPSAVILPAVLSLGEKVGSSGESVLEAFLVGFEVVCKIGKGVKPHLFSNGWHATSTVGVLGAAAAAGKLLGLDSDKIASALGLAGSLAGGLRSNFGTMTKPLHIGKAAENGVLSALLVKNGFTASPQILEVKNGFCYMFSGQYDLNKIVDGFANPCEIVSPGVHLKPYPSCLETHSTIESTLFLVESYDIGPEDVQSVECGLAPLAVDVLIHNNPRTGLEGKFSAPYAVATAVVYRSASLAQYTDEAVRNPTVQAIMQKVTVVPRPELGIGQSAIVTIRLKNGSEYVRRVDITTGHLEKPMSLDQIKNKYRTCAHSVVNDDNIEKSIDKILSLEKLSGIGQLTSLIAGDSSGCIS